MAIGSRPAALVLGVGLLLWAAFRRDWRLFVAPLLAVIITDLLVVRLVKPTFDRPRPCQVLELQTIRGCADGESFPSAHAANTASVALATANPAIGVLSALAGVSRVVEGQHYPSDIVFGWAVGGGVGAAVRWRLRRRTAAA